MRLAEHTKRGKEEEEEELQPPESPPQIHLRANKYVALVHTTRIRYRSFVLFGWVAITLFIIHEEKAAGSY